MAVLIGAGSFPPFARHGGTMSREKWFKAGNINPTNLIDEDIDLREVLIRTEGLGSNTWIITKSGETTYALTRAELLQLKKYLLNRAKRKPSDPLVVSINKLLKQVGFSPSVRVSQPKGADASVEHMLRSLQRKSAQRVLVVGAPDEEIAVWQRSMTAAGAFGSSTTGDPSESGSGSPGQLGSTVFFADDESSDSGVQIDDVIDETVESAVEDSAAELSVDIPDAVSGEPGFLGESAPPPGGGGDDNSGEEPPSDATYINAVIEKYEGGALAVYTTYALDFSVDRTPNTSVSAVGSVAANEQIKNTGVALTLDVELYGNGFTITPEKAKLELNAQGLSTAKARFEIVPRQPGPAELVAHISKDGNFVQMLKIKLDVGGVSSSRPTVVSIGRPVTAAASLKPRRMGLIVEPDGNAFACRVWGVAQKRAALSINPEELAHAVGLLRRAFMDVVTMKNEAGKHPFQTGIDIPPSIAEVSLKVLAHAGHTLFRTIFFHDKASQDCKNLGNWLITEANKAGPGFALQVLGEGFPIPWAALYLTPRWNENELDWQRFLGMKHVIEQMPLGGYGCDTHIVCEPPGLAVALNLNQSIDQQTRTTVVAKQSQYWHARATGKPALSIRTRTTSAQLIQALNDADTDDQIIYFYCHAQSVGLVGGGPDSSTLAMGLGDVVTLGKLKDDAPTDVLLKGAPLVFINACESGDLSPNFYSGFVPYFMSKGARGVIGTECKMPVLFGAAFAESFFEDFLQGTSLGELVLMKRRAFYNDHNNLLGLLYGVHCNIDTKLVNSEAA